MYIYIYIYVYIWRYNLKYAIGAKILMSKYIDHVRMFPDTHSKIRRIDQFTKSTLNKQRLVMQPMYMYFLFLVKHVI